jgi:hypothetical protein
MSFLGDKEGRRKFGNGFAFSGCNGCNGGQEEGRRKMQFYC